MTAGRVDAMRVIGDLDRRLCLHLDELSRCVDSMFEIVDELLPRRSAPPAAPQRVDLDRFVTERAAMLRAAVGRNVALVIEPSAGGCVVMARPIDLERVMLNLVLNASEAMPRGGVVTIRIRMLDANAIEVKWPTGASASVRLTVSDTGAGMSPYWQQFDHSSEEWADGCGLGLASVKLIVIRLGGRFHVDSEEGVGTRVHIDLPVGI